MKTLYEEIGGAPAVAAAVEVFYRKMLMDDRVSGFFDDTDMERQIKLAVARQLDKIEAGAMGLDNPNGSVIVTERNKVALDVLKHTLDSGKRHISIFYGAAHMPDMSQRLRDMGFTPVSIEWETAWDLTIRSDQPSAAERFLKELLHALDE